YDAPRQSIAVLPFLDLTTQEMTEEYFADGMTEELIDKLSKVGAFNVPAATASFYYKGKQVPLASIGTALGVTYLVDGSIRKSGPMLRIAVRLVRARDGYVIWSQTYDRPADDRLKVQDEIAAAVSKYLTEMARQSRSTRGRAAEAGSIARRFSLRNAAKCESWTWRLKSDHGSAAWRTEAICASEACRRVRSAAAAANCPSCKYRSIIRNSSTLA